MGCQYLMQFLPQKVRFISEQHIRTLDLAEVESLHWQVIWCRHDRVYNASHFVAELGGFVNDVL